MLHSTLYITRARPPVAVLFPTAEVECVPQPQDVFLVRLTGEFDLETIHLLREVLDATEGARAIVDVTGVVFADSALLNALLGARERLVLAGPVPNQLRRLFEITCTSELFAQAPDVDAARCLCGK